MCESDDTSVEEHPGRPERLLKERLSERGRADTTPMVGGLPATFFEEVKRTEGSHDEKNRRRSPRA